jgi:hypothetical protein
MEKRRRGEMEKWGRLGCDGSFLILLSFFSFIFNPFSAAG